MTVIRVPDIEEATPLDVIEQIVAAKDWAFDRPNDQEMAVQVPGKWCDYNVFCAWNESDRSDPLYRRVRYSGAEAPSRAYSRAACADQ